MQTPIYESLPSHSLPAKSDKTTGEKHKHIPRLNFKKLVSQISRLGAPSHTGTGIPKDTAAQYIRTCKLYPGTSHEPLRIELQRCRLESRNTKYEAVSWVWGSPLNSTPLLYQGRKIPIRSTLDDALRIFRYPDRPRVLWVYMRSASIETTWRSGRTR
ncbi:heterokaryon incompatibility protein [Paraphaeosphaeria minitans]|uniref:Heterokaryon incompatibility protein n=1 Tax=Paraphaeosphaeria minitans TaxID=565426 RepID=A0A9P6GCH7_9PLEO|nr:heterokaryon incompatibility protein [Paraphaeosphaeria minitans]